MKSLQAALALTGVLFVSACGSSNSSGGNSNTPTGPSRTPANVTITNVSVQPERFGTGYRYVIRFSVRETTGATAATLGAVDIIISANGTAFGQLSVADAFGITALTAGGALDSRQITATDSNASNPAATQLEIRVAFTDAIGTTGRATQVVDVQRILSPPVIVEYASDRTSINPGQSATLRWNVTGATRVTLEPPTGRDVAPSGTMVVTPTSTTTYRLASTNPDGNTERSLTISVVPPAAPALEYRASGVPRSNIITISNCTNGTSQFSNVSLPWSFTCASVPTGQFIYVSAQNDTSSGCIRVQIFKRGTLFRESESCGAFVIATASGTY